jgi:hypothetical protein
MEAKDTPGDSAEQLPKRFPCAYSNKFIISSVTPDSGKESLEMDS